MTIEHALLQLCGAYQNAEQQALQQALNLSLMEFQVLALVGSGYGMTADSLARQLPCPAESLKALVADMQRVQWLQTLPHPQQRQRVLLQLGPKGGAVLQQAEAVLQRVRQQMAQQLTQGFSNAQQQKLAAVLQLLCANLPQDNG
ncbi:MarR family winged helix-turn-helix transcriptional regulator [Shewanella sp. YIC-542]|uniref:MarR family winged helix-turn-helix transcriptional regulator n=1 Tax=Shewanella mytili TaxID=3377111 RepID=UPI00398F55A2